MTLNQITNQILPILYDYTRGIDLLKTLQDQDLMSFYPRQTVQDFLIQEHLATFNPDTEHVVISPFGIYVQEQGGWSIHFSKLEAEKQQQHQQSVLMLEAALRNTEASERSADASVRSVEASIRSAVASERSAEAAESSIKESRNSRNIAIIAILLSLLSLLKDYFSGTH